MSHGRELLERWLASSKLVRPAAAGQPDLVDLARALATRAGVPDLPASSGADALAALIPPADHLVLVLADGLGSSLLETLPEDAFLRRRCVTHLSSVFPSTTASALTSLFTARWPAEHGIVGWWVRLPDADLTATVLPFVERFERVPLVERGLTPAAVFPSASILPRFGHRPLCILPAAFTDSVYAQYISGGTDRLGYESIGEALDYVRLRVTGASPPTYSYVYLPQVDALSHAEGPCHASVSRLVAQLDGQLEALHREVGHAARIVVTADHGQLELPPERSLVIAESDELLERLLCPPSGEPAVPMFHVAHGEGERFARDFERRFGSYFALVSRSDAEELQLFGPRPLSPVSRARIGDFIAVAAEPASLVYLPAAERPPRIRGIHAGLSAAEMRIPLVVA